MKRTSYQFIEALKKLSDEELKKLLQPAPRHQTWFDRWLPTNKRDQAVRLSDEARIKLHQQEWQPPGVVDWQEWPLPTSYDFTLHIRRLGFLTEGWNWPTDIKRSRIKRESVVLGCFQDTNQFRAYLLTGIKI